jgi:hypothetical protein
MGGLDRRGERRYRTRICWMSSLDAGMRCSTPSTRPARSTLSHTINVRLQGGRRAREARRAGCTRVRRHCAASTLPCNCTLLGIAWNRTLAKSLSGCPPLRQPRGNLMVSLVKSHANAIRIGWHLWEIDFRFAPVISLGWIGIESHTCSSCS